jgi:hypothetical protein
MSTLMPYYTKVWSLNTGPNCTSFDRFECHLLSSAMH